MRRDRMREEVLKEKKQMENRWNEWKRNPKPSRPSPPDPNIIDWEYRSDMIDFEYTYDKSFLFCGVWAVGFVIVLRLLFF
jgi:hypothetical protein